MKGALWWGNVATVFICDRAASLRLWDSSIHPHPTQMSHHQETSEKSSEKNTQGQKSLKMKQQFELLMQDFLADNRI